MLKIRLVREPNKMIQYEDGKGEKI
jgi:hypothetical protein